MVRITTDNSVGSGFIYEVGGETAYVLTNQHVIAGSAVPTVQLQNGRDYIGAVVAVDSLRDFAVLRICCGRFNSLSFASDSDLEVGTEVASVGYALGLPGEATVSTGIISAVRYDSDRSTVVVQTDAHINPGSSGGPLLALDGRVLGINTFKYVGKNIEGVGFALSGPYIKRLLQSGLLSGSDPAALHAPDGDRILHGPMAGSMRLPLLDRVFQMANKRFERDVAIEATFRYPAGFDRVRYGFIIASEQGVAVLVEVWRRNAWSVTRWIPGRGGELEHLGEIQQGVLETGEYAHNHVKVIIEDYSIIVYVNGVRVPGKPVRSPFLVGAVGNYGIVARGDYLHVTEEEYRPVLSYEYWQVWDPCEIETDSHCK